MKAAELQEHVEALRGHAREEFIRGTATRLDVNLPPVFGVRMTDHIDLRQDGTWRWAS